MKNVIKKNILSKKDKKLYNLSLKRIIIASLVLLFLMFIFLFINGAMIYKGV